MQYDTILQSFARRTIQDTLKDIRDEVRIPDNSFRSQLEQALSPVLNRKSNTLLNILEGFIETLGASSSFRKIRDGLLSRKEQGDYDAICGFLDLEREQHDKKYLNALKGVLRKYIADFDKKREDELTRQMIQLIEKKFAGLDQMVKSKEYNDLIKEIDQLQPREITPTNESGLYYQKKCTELIAGFQQALILKSKEDMGKLVKQLPQSSEEFSEKMRQFQESLDQEKRFYLVLPGLDQKIQALNEKGQQMFFDNNMNLTNPIYTEFVHKVNVYMENLSGRYPVDDANWTQSLHKLCILCAQFPTGEFESLRNKIHAHFSDMIKSDFKKRFKLIIEDRNILRNFQDEQDGNGGQRPAHTFKQLMLSINQAKENVEKMLADQITASLGDLDIIVKRFIQYIAKSIREYLESLFNKELQSLLYETSTKDESPSTPKFDIEGIQAALNLIESFAQSAIQFQFNEISDELRNYSDFIVQSGAKALEEQQKNFCELLESQEPQSQEIKILENTDLKLIYQQVINLRKISQVKLATSKYFAEIQKKVLQTVKTKSISIKNTMALVEKGEHLSYQPSEKKTFFKKMLQVVEEYGYFQGILEQDQQQEVIIKMEMQTIFDSCMQELYGKIHLHKVKDPKSWQDVLKIGIIVDDYEQIKAIFAKIGLKTSQTHNDNVRKSFEQAVSTAMTTIVESLSQPIIYMTRDHYQDFSNYQKYLKILQENKQIFLPLEEQQKYAKRIMDHIKLIVKKQIQKLEETFQYRFQRYLFSDSNEPDKYCYHKRPSPIQFSLEELKAEPEILEVADQANLDKRLEEACKEIYSLFEVTYWLIEQFIFEDRLTQQSQSGSTMSDFLKRLNFINIKNLYIQFKSSLLDTFFIGFKIQEERLKHEILKEKSLFYYKKSIVQYLRRVDKFLNLQSLVNQVDSLTNLFEKQKYTSFFNDLKIEESVIQYPSIAIALQKFEDELKKEATDETTKFKILYCEKQLKKLSVDLESQIEFIKIEMKKFIKQEYKKHLNFLQVRTQDFSDTLFETQEICETVLFLDANIEFLPEYVDIAEIEEAILQAINELEEVINQTFQCINDLSLKYKFDQIFNKMFTIDQLIKKMLNSTLSSNLDCLPSRNSMKDFCTKMFKDIKDKKAAITVSFRQVLQDFEEAIRIGVSQVEIVNKKYGCTLAFIINSIEKLEQIEFDWSDTKTQISSFVSTVINEQKLTLDQLKPENAKDYTQINDLQQIITSQRTILHYLPEKHFMDLKVHIEFHAQEVLKQNKAITQDQINSLFEVKNFKGIADAIKLNSKVFDEEFIRKLKAQFSKLISSECEDGRKIVCDKKVNPEKVRVFINDRVPQIMMFFDSPELQCYILENCHNDFSNKLRDNFTNLYVYALHYIQKTIELVKIPDDDESLENVRTEHKSIQLVLTKTIDALDILDHLNQSSQIPRQKLIERYDYLLSRFFTECSKIIKAIIEKFIKAIHEYLIQIMKVKQNPVAATHEHQQQKHFINAKEIIILLKIIVANEKLFIDEKFIKTFELNNEDYCGEKGRFLIAVRDTFRGQEPKKILHDLGLKIEEQIKKQDFEKQFFVRTSTLEKSDIYGILKKLHQDLTEVAKIAQSEKFFQYEMKDFSYLQKVQKLIDEKIQDKKKIFIQEVQFYIVDSNAKNRLPKNNDTEVTLIQKIQQYAVHKIFERIYSGYLNFECILEPPIIVDPLGKEAIEELMNKFFGPKVDYRLNLMALQANKLCEDSPKIQENFSDLTKFADIIIEIHLMKVSFTHLQQNIQSKQDAIINFYEDIYDRNNNKGSLESLRRLIQGSSFGAQIISESQAFQAFIMKELAKKLNTKTPKDVLIEISGKDIIVNGNDIQLIDNFDKQVGDKEITGKTQILLKEKYDEFQKIYQQELKTRTVAQFDDNNIPKPIDIKQLAEEIKQNKIMINMLGMEWDKQNIQKLPKLLAQIFALWSLMKPEQLQKQQQKNESRKKKDKEEGKLSSLEQDGEFLLYLTQPHPAQVIGLMRILGIGYSPKESEDKTRLRNNLLQIKTGEGKSVTLAVLSIIFALCDFDVGCACYSAYLSDRDFQAFEPMFKILGLQDRIIYSTFNQICEMEINKNGDLRQIMQNLVLIDKKKVDIKSDDSSRPQILLIDEVDAFFQFFGNTYVPQAQIQGKEVEKLIDYIWANRNNDLKIEKMQKSEQYIKVLQLFEVNYAFLLEEAVKQMIVDLSYVPKFDLGVKVEGLDNIMDIIDGKIKYKLGDKWTEKVRDSYRTMFAYYKYFDQGKIELKTLQEYKAIGIKFTELSYAEIPLKKSFRAILGVTGTLDTLSNEQLKIMKTVYNFTSQTYAPSVYDIPKDKKDKIQGLRDEILIINDDQLIKCENEKKKYDPAIFNKMFEVANEMAIRITKDKDQWFKELTFRIEQLKKSKNDEEALKDNQRAVIIFFQSEEILNEFTASSYYVQYQESQTDQEPYILKDKLENIDRDPIIKYATMDGQLTLATREFGRGTDFKYHGSAVIDAGGLAVIQAFFTSDYSEEIQIRGRTRRQGTTGSFEIIIWQQDLIDHFGIKDSQISFDPEKDYKMLHQKRITEYDAKQKDKKNIRDQLQKIHKKYMKHLDTIKKTVKGEENNVQETNEMIAMLKNLNFCHQYKYMVKCIKTLVLIDATVSMGSLLENVQKTILQYFTAVCKRLHEANYNEPDIFKIQIAFYRNYDSGEKVLSVSDWSGPNQSDDLQKFVNKEEVSGGWGDEAMEVALWHANREIKTPSEGKEPVSLIFVIGDAIANPNKQTILFKKYTIKEKISPSMTDEEAKIHGFREPWNNTLEAKYGPSKTWNEHLDEIKQFRDEDGISIPVQSFYVLSKEKLACKKPETKLEKEKLETFYSNLRVNNTLKDDGRWLDLSKTDALVTSLSVYTMNIIADKNPKLGDCVKLKQLAAELNKNQQLSHA